MSERYRIVDSDAVREDEVAGVYEAERLYEAELEQYDAARDAKLSPQRGEESPTGADDVFETDPDFY